MPKPRGREAGLLQSWRRSLVYSHNNKCFCFPPILQNHPPSFNIVEHWTVYLCLCQSSGELPVKPWIWIKYPSSTFRTLWAKWILETFEMSLLGRVLCPHQKKIINFYSCVCHNVSPSMNQFLLPIYITCNCTIWPLCKTSIWMSAWQGSFLKKTLFGKGKNWSLSCQILRLQGGFGGVTLGTSIWLSGVFPHNCEISVSDLGKQSLSLTPVWISGPSQ